MNNYRFLEAYPNLRETLLKSRFLDIIPGGFSIATDVSCKTIIHNPIAAKFLRIEPWGQLSYSAPVPPPLKAYHNGKLLSPSDLPSQRAAWYGEEVSGLEVEFVWEDGVAKIARFSSSPLRDSQGAICGAITTMQDITDLVQMARELDKDRSCAEDRFSKAFFLSPQQKSIVRLSDWRYIDVNRSFAKARNQAREEIIGRTPMDLGVPFEEAEMIFRMLNEKGAIDKYEVTLPRHDGTVGNALLSAEKIEIEGNVCGLFDYIEITEMKKMQAEMSRLDRLNLIGQMAAGLGHEIRNPMTTVRGFLQLLGDKEEFALQRSIFDLLISELDRANSIITEFLSLARSQPAEMKTQNLNDILNNLYPMLEANAFKQNKYLQFIPGEIPNNPLNTNEVHQLVLNLCYNGLQAMKEQACLTLRTYTENDQIVLSVQDEGCGIKKEDIAKLGTPFYTTKENGTGLGLAVCYRIAANHNAKIDVESNAQGTTFFVRFNTGSVDD